MYFVAIDLSTDAAISLWIISALCIVPLRKSYMYSKIFAELNLCLKYTLRREEFSL